jgi:hypothetical protein
MINMQPHGCQVFLAYSAIVGNVGVSSNCGTLHFGFHDPLRAGNSSSVTEGAKDSFYWETRWEVKKESEEVQRG